MEFAKTIGVGADRADGSYTIFDPISKKAVVHARVAVEVDRHWLKSSDYPQHSIAMENVAGASEPQRTITVSNTGLNGRPDLIYT
ncbi:MAG TPA: hypothetical protein VGU90_11535, partial [Terriglobales bacterium]|nr:hypothetical protein [Terriglobales bacterium]